MTTALARVDAAMRALEVATDVRDVVRIRNEATVLKALVERARMGFEATLRTCELEVRASRRAGEMLITLGENGGRRGPGQGKEAAATLADLNVEKWESHRWQEIARIPDAMLDAYIERQREQRKRVTVNGFVGFSSESNEWGSPRIVVDGANAVMGRIDLDPCAESGRRHNVNAARHYTKEDDGLSKPWNGSVFMNPPYGDEIPLWTSKLVAEMQAGRCTQAITLTAARTDTAWFRQIAEQDRLVCFVTGRLVYTPRPGTTVVGQSSPFPSAIMGLGVRRAKFIETYGPMGLIYERAA